MTEADHTTKIARCYLKESETVRSWIIPRCPWCGKRHTHGGGKVTENPHDFLGHRIAHCSVGSGRDYELVELDRCEHASRVLPGPFPNAATIGSVGPST